MLSTILGDYLVDGMKYVPPFEKDGVDARDSLLNVVVNPEGKDHDEQVLEACRIRGE
jgi:hypothetical protein